MIHSIKVKLICILFMIFGLLSTMTVFADASTDQNCQNNQELNRLDSNIDSVKDNLRHYRFGHGWQNSTKSRLKRELQQLMVEKSETVDNLFLNGCDSLRKQASLEAQLEYLEKVAATSQK